MARTDTNTIKPNTKSIVQRAGTDRSHDARLTSEERRHHTRLPFHTEVDVHEITSAGTVTNAQRCSTVDVSPAGLGFLSRKTYPVGSKLVLILRLPDHREKLLFGVVRAGNYAADARYQVGVELMPEADFARQRGVSAWLSQHHAH
ncbi:MAG: PilZ domain-containing protein [Phycisphaerales bacterium]|nr:PilZ domain-containing protein [Phycisphaerales bacterium]